MFDFIQLRNLQSTRTKQKFVKLDMLQFAEGYGGKKEKHRIQNERKKQREAGV